MIKLKQILNTLTESLERLQFSNWKVPDLKQLKLEFKVEHQLKRNNFFESEEDFLERVDKGNIITITEQDDRSISYRSRTKSFDQLHNLIRSYASYPEFRNEDTLKNIYKGFREGKAMDLPIVIEFSNGARRIFSGNTRLDVAFQLGVTPVKVLLIKSDQEY